MSDHAPRRHRRRQEPTPVQRALGLLTRREHSRKELTRKLAARGVEKEDAQAAVARLAAATIRPLIGLSGSPRACAGCSPSESASKGRASAQSPKKPIAT